LAFIPVTRPSLEWHPSAIYPEHAGDLSRFPMAAESPRFYLLMLKKSNEILQAVIVIHGLGRNASTAFRNMAHAIAKTDMSSSTVVIAPHFPAKDARKPARNEEHWSGHWAQGDGSLVTRPRKPISSFTVVDELIATVRSGLFPNLRRIIVIGHAAGHFMLGW
jgi:hypothetical protein